MNNPEQRRPRALTVEEKARSRARPKVTLYINGSLESRLAVEAFEQAEIGIRTIPSSRLQPLAKFGGLQFTGAENITDLARTLHEMGEKFIAASPYRQKDTSPEGTALREAIKREYQLQFDKAHKIIDEMSEKGQ